jgi:hypothetical protein
MAHRDEIGSANIPAIVLAELNHVEMRSRSHFVDKDKFMLGPVQRPHPRIGFVPDAEV